ncbi:MAG: TonB family protein [Hahellaceae bacterium]|nr:TonB family protein [Hahellaceae bacterium]MCP5209999.1 TonB family protein [Hahellaceae bacterium]
MTITLEINEIYDLSANTPREDAFDASLIGVLVLSIVIHLLAGVVFIALVNFPEPKKPSLEEHIIHRVTLITPQSKADAPVHQNKPQDKKAEEKPAAINEKKEIEKKIIKPPAETLPYIKELEASRTNKNTVASKSKTTVKKPVKGKSEPQLSAGTTTSTDKILPKKGVVNYGDEISKDEPDISQEEKDRINKAITECLDANFERILSLWVKPGEFNRRLSGVIKITLDDSGNIAETRISTSSGSLPLDLSVVEAIQRAKRFSPPSIGSLPRNFSFEFESDMR